MLIQLITADLHLNHLPRDTYRRVFMKETLPGLIKNHKVNELIIAGDLTTEKDRHSAVLVNIVVEYLYELSRLCPIIIIRGNHDYLDEDNPFFKFLCRIPNMTWINVPTYYADALILPHTHDYTTAWDGLKLRPIIYAHNTFQGARGSQGRELSGIPPELFKQSKVYSGDVHVPQSFANITYIGAPYHIDFGDEFEPRVLIKDANFKSVNVPGAQKRLLEIPVNGSLPMNVKAKDIYKIRVHIAPAMVDTWSKIRDKIYAWGQQQDICIDSVKPVMPGLISSMKSHRPRTDAEYVRNHAKRSNADALTLKVGLRLLDELDA